MADRDLAASRRFAAKLFRFSGLTYPEIARKLGVTRGVVIEYCIGVDKGRRLSPQQIRARKLKSEGMSYAEVAKTMGFSVQNVYHLIRVTHNRPEGQQECLDCGKTIDVFHCHHTNYESGDFVILCASCHIKRHWKENRKSMGRKIIRSGSRISQTEK